MSTISGVSAEELARVFHYFHQAPAHDSKGLDSSLRILYELLTSPLRPARSNDMDAAESSRVLATR
jgi:hypothetical protein